jgi:transposase
MTIENLFSMYRRWRSGQSINEISRQEGFDRKTVRMYLLKFKSAGLSASGDRPESGQLHAMLAGLLPSNDRKHVIQDEFRRYEDEIVALVSDEREPVKPKTAYRIMRRKYDISGSYESFKVYFRRLEVRAKGRQSVPRLELPPGKEIQVDYCFVGYHLDADSRKNRKVYAFIGKLSCSRLPFVQFTYTQKQESFVESNVGMLEFYGGASEYITIDNLKQGVLKPDIYDPTINRAYAEFAEYYRTFINPCVVGHSKGKAKVERQVQEVRELYRELKAVHPTYSMRELNAKALDWCRNEYGGARHGTTGIEPMKAFEHEEKGCLQPLPEIRFEVPRFKPVKVAPDQFFTFDGKRYAMPRIFRGSQLMCRQTGTLLRIFDERHTLLRQYVIDSRRARWCEGDFPESQEAMMQGSYPHYLISRGRSIGPQAALLIESILRPHAFIKARAARGVLSVLEEYRDYPFLESVCSQARRQAIFVPKQIKYLLESEKRQSHLRFAIQRSPLGEAMIRDIAEYIN